MDTVIQSQMDTVINSLRQRFRQTRSASRSSSRLRQHNTDELDAYTPDLMPPTPTSISQAPTPLPTTSTSVWQRGNSVKSRNSFKLLKRKIFGAGGTVKTRTNDNDAVPSDENIAWTAPSSPQLGDAFSNEAKLPRRRNSARLRELQRLLRAYHEQRNGWASTPNSPQIQQRSVYRHEHFHQQHRHAVNNNIPMAKLNYCRGEMGSERPLVLENRTESHYPAAGGPNAQRRKANLAELELALLNGANPSSYPTSLITTTGSSQSISPVQQKSATTVPTATAQSIRIVEETYRSTNFLAGQQHQVIADGMHYQQDDGGMPLFSTAFIPSRKASRTGFLEQRQIQLATTRTDLPLISPSPYEQIKSYVAPSPHAILPISNAKIRSQISIDQKAKKDLHAGTMDKGKQKRKKRRSRHEEVSKIQNMSEQRSEIRYGKASDTLKVQHDESSPKFKAQQNLKTLLKSGSTSILSLGVQHFVQRHRHQQYNNEQPKQQQQKQKPAVEPILKSARSEPRLARREHWLLMSRPEPPGSSFLSPTPSIAVLEHLERLHDQINETKYVTAVFESRGGLGPVLCDVQAELEHWLGNASNLLAIACEVHWSVPERFRSRQIEIELKQCLHAVLRVNNRRVLSLNDNKEEETTTAQLTVVSPESSPVQMARGQRHRSYSTHSLNRTFARPLPIALARSKTEESCIRDAELDAFQGIYRRFYPALLRLQDPATVKAHQGYWTLESLTDERKAPLVPDPARFLYQPEQPEQLARKSLVALNMAVLRLVGDERDYDADEARAAEGHATPGLKESDL